MILEKIDSVRKIVEKHYGRGKIIHIEYLSSGRINDIFRVDLQNCDTDKIVIRLRYFNDPNFGQRFGTEIMINDILKGNINYPKLLVYDNSRCLVPYDYSILSFVEGRLFSIHDTPENYEKLGEIAKIIHMTPVPSKYSEPFLKDIDGYYIKRFKNIIESSQKYDKYVYELIRDAMKYYYPGVYRPEDVSLTHHDFHEKNLIVNNGGINVLDWESARVEATEVEFIRAKYYLFNRTSKENVEAFMRGYGKIHFTDNFFMQELMWLARISNFERTFPPREDQKGYWCTSDFLNKNLEELITNYKGRGSYTTVEEIITPKNLERSSFIDRDNGRR